MSITLPHNIAEHLFSLIQVRTGLVLNTHQQDNVAVICAEMANSISPAQNIVTMLADSPLNHPLWQELIIAVTVGETYFFRNQAQFDALRNHILPELIAERRKSDHKHLRFWTAGCSTGEEPYSLAILLHELLPDIETWSITLLATDINKSFLEYARNAVYGTRSFRSETPDDLRERWFTRVAHGYQVQPVIHNMVMFKHQNLVFDDYPSIESNTMFMDVILCRNVTIYFDRQTTIRIAKRFHQALTPKGWLVVGHSEPQSDIYRGFESRNFKNTVVYQKSSDPSSIVVSDDQIAQIKPVQSISKEIIKPSPKPVAARKPKI